MMMSTPDTNLLAPAPGCNNPGGEGWRHLPRGENCSQDDPIIKLPQPGKFLSRVENQKLPCSLLWSQAMMTELLRPDWGKMLALLRSSRRVSCLTSVCNPCHHWPRSAGLRCVSALDWSEVPHQAKNMWCTAWLPPSCT